MAKKRKSKNSFKKVKQRVTTTLVFVGLTTTICITVYGVWAARNILQPLSSFAAETVTVHNSISETQTLFFLLVLDEDEYVKEARLVLVNSADSVVKETVIPENTLLHLPYGLKEFKLKSLYKLAQLENPASSFNLINQTLIEYFGVSTQNMLILKNNIADNTPFDQWLQSPVTMFHLAFDENWVKQNIQTNKSRMDLLKLARELQKIPDQNNKSINVEEQGIVSEEDDKDNSKVLVTDQNKLDTYVKKSFQSDAILDEKADILIQNATDTQGLAARVSRIISNSGGVIIELKNATTDLAVTTVTIHDKKWLESATLQQIQNTLPGCKIETSTDTNSKADIVVNIGNDYAKMVMGQSDTQ